MTEPLPRHPLARRPLARQLQDQPECAPWDAFGEPSPDLRRRTSSRIERFPRRGDADDQREGGAA